MTRVGQGAGVVYAYGYACLPGRIKIGRSIGSAADRIADQINASTPDKPVLLLEILTDNGRVLEGAIHRALEYRGQRVNGGGTEWFTATPEDVIGIYNFLSQQ